MHRSLPPLVAGLATFAAAVALGRIGDGFGWPLLPFAAALALEFAVRWGVRGGLAALAGHTLAILLFALPWGVPGGAGALPSTQIETIVAALTAGAIGVPLTLRIGGARDRSVRLAGRLRRRAYRDELTGLPNRGFAEIALRRALERTEDGPPLTILLLDIDRFKRINDRWGHAVGDRVLRGVAEVAGGAMRQIDTVARWGGEEFLVLLPATAPGDAQRVADRLRVAIAAHDFGLGEAVTVSVGIATLRADDDLDAILGRADRYLYQAKAAGRDASVHQTLPGILSIEDPHGA